MAVTAGGSYGYHRAPMVHDGGGVGVEEAALRLVPAGCQVPTAAWAAEAEVSTRSMTCFLLCASRRADVHVFQRWLPLRW